MFAVGHIYTSGTNRLGIITKTNSGSDRKLQTLVLFLMYTEVIYLI